jgi:hypothetical protein
MKREPVVLFIGLLMLAGCTMPIYKGGIEPIYPGVRTFGKTYETVETLTPTFRWKSSATSPCTYDFAIWDVGQSIPAGMGTAVTKGPAVYYKEGLATTEHTVEVPLSPDSRYYWSVRTRADGKVSAWATYDYHQWLVIAAAQGYDWPYAFRTPVVPAK